MEKIDLATVIQEVISTFCRNRIGDKPHVFVVLAPAMTRVPWKNQTIKDVVRCFLYEALSSSHPDAHIDVALRKRFPLNDLNAFVGIQPSYWLQLRVSGRGLRIVEPVIEDLFADHGYRCEEWLGVEQSAARLGIFGAVESLAYKMVFVLETARHVVKCDLLLPVIDQRTTSPLGAPREAETPQT